MCPVPLRIAVVGGGVSGQRAALSLGRAGQSVTLFEKNRHLGGRAFSFVTPEFGEIDIGQHVWLKCCAALERLISDLGVPDDWVYRQEHFAIPYKSPDAADFTLGSSPLPWLLHLLPSFLRFPGLTLGDKLRLGYGMARARLYSAKALEALDAVTFAEWLARHHQAPAAVARLWEPLVLAVCNMRAGEVSARHGLFTFRQSLLKSRHAADICFFRRPLSDIFDRQARRALTEAGVEVVSGARVEAIRPGTPVRLTLGNGGERDFDRVVLALPPARMRALLPGAAMPEPPGDTAIVGLLLKFAAPVMDGLFFGALDSPIQFAFNKTAVLGRESADGSQMVEVVISGAAREARLGVEKVAGELLPALAKLLPRARTTPVLARRLVVHGGATFAVAPGGEGRRLAATISAVPNVVFAGDGAATGWPSTMESAARAGEMAARAACGFALAPPRRGRETASGGLLPTQSPPRRRG